MRVLVRLTLDTYELRRHFSVIFRVAFLSDVFLIDFSVTLHFSNIFSVTALYCYAVISLQDHAYLIGLFTCNIFATILVCLEL